jgi:hypothetical protein
MDRSSRCSAAVGRVDDRANLRLVDEHRKVRIALRDDVEADDVRPDGAVVRRYAVSELDGERRRKILRAVDQRVGSPPTVAIILAAVRRLSPTMIPVALSTLIPESGD